MAIPLHCCFAGDRSRAVIYVLYCLECVVWFVIISIVFWYQLTFCLVLFGHFPCKHCLVEYMSLHSFVLDNWSLAMDVPSFIWRGCNSMFYDSLTFLYSVFTFDKSSCLPKFCCLLKLWKRWRVPYLKLLTR